MYQERAYHDQLQPKLWGAAARGDDGLGDPAGPVGRVAAEVVGVVVVGKLFVSSRAGSKQKCDEPLYGKSGGGVAAEAAVAVVVVVGKTFGLR